MELQPAASSPPQTGGAPSSGGGPARPQEGSIGRRRERRRAPPGHRAAHRIRPQVWRFSSRATWSGERACAPPEGERDAFGAAAFSDSISSQAALIFLGGANLAAALYEYGLAQLTRAFPRRWSLRRTPRQNRCDGTVRIQLSQGEVVEVVEALESAIGPAAIGAAAVGTARTAATA